MNQQEQKYMEALYRDRSESADTFEKPSNRTMWRSIVEKYSDQAHFIYELIQNADDAGATSARFVLEKDRLIFAHNGKRYFSISNPVSEDADSKEGRLGDINAITGIAFSNKTTQENKIGKFGVGFKAVFQYTSTPHVYDPKFRFKIERYIVPVALENDYPDRGADETLFVFPFDNKSIDPVQTYSDIEAKLKTLKYPVLFLGNLASIVYTIGGFTGAYRKRISREYTFGADVVEKVSLIKIAPDEEVTTNLFLFSRKKDGLRYSIGYFLDEEDNLIPVKEPAFCYFTTKEETGLNFLIHAPFLLTDSREGVRAGIRHNERMVDLLADLSADSFMHLISIGTTEGHKYITDSILDIIPISEDDFAPIGDTSRISFKPIMRRILAAFSSQKIIPSRDGYVNAKDAFTVSNLTIADLFSDEQVAYLCRNPKAKLVFCSIGRDDIAHSNRKLNDYIKQITQGILNEDNLLKIKTRYLVTRNVYCIDAEFIERQSTEWLQKFYKWLGDTRNRTDIAKYAPLFLDQDSKAIPAFDEDGKHMIYFPMEGISGYRTVRKDLLSVKETREFFEKIEITFPSLKDHVYDLIRELKTGSVVDYSEVFRTFFKYYLSLTHTELGRFISSIKELSFIECYDIKDENTILKKKAENIYFPSRELRFYFLYKTSRYFLNEKYYNNICGEENESKIREFLIKLGVNETPGIITRILSDEEVEQWSYYLPKPERSTRKITYYEKTIDGLDEFLDHDEEYCGMTTTFFVWNSLLNLISSEKSDLENLLTATCDYYYSRPHKIEYKSSVIEKLRTKCWLFDKEASMWSPADLDINDLSDEYDTESSAARKLIAFLKFGSNLDNDELLSENQKKDIEIGRLCKEYNITKEDLLRLAKEKEIEKRAKALASQNRQTEQNGVTVQNTSKPINSDNEENSSETESLGIRTAFESAALKTKVSDSVIKVAADIFERAETDKQRPEAKKKIIIDDDPADEDEYTPKTVDYKRKVETEKEKAAQAVEKIVMQEELQNTAESTPVYSYSWFKTLLEMELLNSSTANNSSREVSISFASVELEAGTKRTLILKHPNRYIPQFIEDLSDFPVVLHSGDTQTRLIAEVANVKSYTLRIKLKSELKMTEAELVKVNEAKIDVQSPAFLMESLKECFSGLGYAPDYNMKEHLCENIEFVFGPPGTGKTTYLASEVIIPLMKQESGCRVLVLTPTNKAADVLVQRVMTTMKADHSYKDWLLRFGGTSDEQIEQSGVYKERSYDIRKAYKNVTVTTIARFTYDFYFPQGMQLYLRDIKWDYIIIDEASMIPIVNIIYPLYKQNPEKFIIAGDPFQIEPITSVELWKDQNIYKMVKLNSFSNPTTVPHDYKVVSLQTQYRSVPEIGTVFSRFAYDGILKHNRTSESLRPLNIGNKINVEPLNIIKFPVSRYESIYRPKRLNNSSSYQIYSALFTYEFTLFISKLISENNHGTKFRVGVIAPYRAQADLIEKLTASEKYPAGIEIQVGTIHSFQGDECDIIFVVFNTPAYISESKDMFLNKKTILNVAISRARDYLFVVMPDDYTDRIENLKQVNRIEKYIDDIGKYTEYHTSDLEMMMFGKRDYLEENSFTTGHQSVNVYGLPEKKYEIRSEDTAVDVQVHKAYDESMESEVSDK
ncbi:MAG: AAA family ATPase [Oscillospiraceae bacterium]|nr:AAA family ATPase [Oscillospiraceae bacterium]